MIGYVMPYEFADRLYKKIKKNYTWVEYRITEWEARMWPDSPDGHAVYSN